MTDNLKRPVKQKEIWAVVIAIIFIGIPFFGATVLRKAYPHEPIIATLFDVWWKRFLIIIVGSLIAWQIAKAIDRRSNSK